MDAQDLRQPDWLVPLAFCPPLALYLTTMSPTLTYGGDCGELIAASYVLGNAHPTGYPLYLLLGKLFSLLPIGEVAFRYNLFSAVCGAGTAAVVAVAVFRLCRDACAALVGGWSLACAYVFWTQSVIAEVYALSALLMSLCLLAAVTFLQTHAVRWLHATAFIFGLGLTNHLPVIFIGVPLVGYCVWTYRRVGIKTFQRSNVPTFQRSNVPTFQRSNVPTFQRSNTHIHPNALFASLSFCLFFLLPLMLYLYLPIRAHAHPPMNWGNPATLSAFWAHVSGQLYQSHVFAVPLVLLPHRLFALCGLMVLQFLLAFPVGLLGGWRLAREGWGRALLGGILFNIVVYINYDVLDLWNFFFPVYVTFGLCVGLGAAALRAWVRRFFVALSRPAFAVTTVCLLCLPPLQAWAAYPRATMRGNRRAHQDALALLRATAPHSTLFIKGDEALFGVWYLQHVEGRGKDRKVIYGKEVVEGLEQGTLWYRVEAALRRGRVYLNFWERSIAERYGLRPCGPVCEVVTWKPEPRRIERPEGKPFSTSRRNALWRVRLSQTSIKRGNMLTLTVRWQPHSPIQWAQADLLFAHDGLGGDAPSEDHELSHALAINKQFLSWREERPLRGEHPGVWEETFPLAIRDDSMIGQFRLFARLAVNGRPSPWRRVGTLMIVDK